MGIAVLNTLKLLCIISGLLLSAGAAAAEKCVVYPVMTDAQMRACRSERARPAARHARTSKRLVQQHDELGFMQLADRSPKQQNASFNNPLVSVNSLASINSPVSFNPPASFSPPAPVYPPALATGPMDMASNSGQSNFVLQIVIALTLMGGALSMLGYRYWKHQRAMVAKLAWQAQTDTLTRLPNRRHFLELARGEVSRSRRYGSPLSMLMLDIDFFKRVNDTYGHETGNIVLKHVAEICRKTTREVDIVGRIGGEEFAALLPETNQEHAREVAERMRLAVAGSETPSSSGSAVKVTVSIGVTTLADANGSVDLLLDQADQAMYEVKRSGRNNVSVIKNPIETRAATADIQYGLT